jgi:hypothetical protein
MLLVIAIALWRAAIEHQKLLFIAILVILLTIPPLSIIVAIAYLFFFSKEKLRLREIKSWFGK